MNWLAFALVAWVAFGLELGLQSTLQLETLRGAPSVVFIVCVYVALHAPTRLALWAALVLGLVLDLLTETPTRSGGTAVVAGPYALGYVLATQLVLSLRGLINKRNPLSYSLLALLGSLVVHAVYLALFQLRALYDPGVEWSAAAQVKSRAGASMYTALVALPLSVLLVRLDSFLGFQAAQRRFVRRT